jgi:PAS domain S-box-containing protein
MSESQSWLEFVFGQAKHEQGDDLMLLFEAFEAANVGVWSIDESNRMVSWGSVNQSVATEAEANQETALDDALAQVHPDDLPHLQQAIAEAFRTGEVFVSEHRMLIGGDYIWLFAKGRVFDDAKGRRLTGIVIDITKRKVRELEHEQSRNQLRGLIDTLDTYVGLLTLDGKLIEANQAALAIADLTKEDVIGLPFWESYWLGYSEENKQRIKDAIRAVAAGQTVQFDMDVRVAGGEFITIDFRMAPLYDEAGEVAYLVASAINITPRLAAQQEIRYLASILEEVSEGIASTDANRVIRSWNRGAELMYGYTAEEAIGSHVEDLLQPRYMSETFEAAFATLHRTGYWQGEVQQRHKDGRLIDVLVSLKLLRDKTGAMSGIIAANRDISAWKRLERERSRLLTTLEDERARLEMLLEYLPVGVVVAEAPSGKITVFNRRAEEILGHSLIDTESIEDYRRYGAIHEDGRPYEPADHPLAKVLQHQQPVDGHVMRYLRPDGWEVLIDVNAAPVFDEAGKLLAGVVTLDDITEQKRTEERLRQQIKQQAAIAQLGQDALAADELGDFLDTLCGVLKALLNVNYVSILELAKGADELLARAGVGWDDALSSSCVRLSEHPLGARLLQHNLSIVSVDDDPALALPAYLQRVGVKSGLVVKVLGAEKPFGLLEMYSRQPRTFTADDQQFVRAVTHILSEFISRKQSEAALVELNASLESRVEARTAELQAVNKELEAFAYSVSHDLRAPLRGIDGFSKALLEDYGEAFDDTASHYLERVRAGAQRMGQLIDELLAFSRLSRSALRLTRVDLAQLAHDIVRELRELEPQRKVAVTIEPELWVTGDANLLAFALQNLFSNAWKFTRYTAAPEIFFGRHTADDENEEVFVMRDNGAGFDMLYVDKLFGAFQRLHTAETFEGTGIGLANVQRIIHRHGGRIWAEGEVDKGAAFYFTLEGDVSETTGNDPAG